MPESQAAIGYGSLFAIETENSPLEFANLAEVFNITPPSMTVDQIDVSHMQSPDRRREFIGGLIDPGECSFQMNYIPGSTSDGRLNDLLDLPIGASRRRQCLITYPNGVTHQFAGELTGYEIDNPTEDKMTATVTFKVSGPVTRSAG